MTVVWIALAWLLLPVPLAVVTGRLFARGRLRVRDNEPAEIEVGAAGVSQPMTSSSRLDADNLAG